MKSYGFSIIELLIVVIVVGILAAIAIPQFSRQQQKAKTSEVPGMFAAIKQSQHAYKAEYGRFLSTGTSESDVYPALLGSGEPKKKKWEPGTSTNWYQLGVQPPDYYVYCGYVTLSGSAGDVPSGVNGVKSFRNQTPQKPWFYIMAHCDLDGNSAVNTMFVTSSERTDVIEMNGGM
ncbi:prepilin-type N-terminal cleavage/methylation domain-containing protein [Myxococcota bacterium]|nr:prepilin-type N-terminal cleavage/methylation domain-containing protein [Myxococcota bacterium]MBU1536925.1 prepilin-type N-terminal cleavage/methylation domain-containing protein [Myxococcota bacterium]